MEAACQDLTPSLPEKGYVVIAPVRRSIVEQGERPGGYRRDGILTLFVLEAKAS
jgi:hypothetical protein